MAERPWGLAALALLLAGAAAAQEAGIALRPEDRARLGALDASVGQGLRQALATGDAGQVDDAVTALRGAPLAADRVEVAALVGDWSCRMIRIGGMLPAVSYPPFRCRIGTGAAPEFEKLTGSQRTRGHLHRDGGRWIYLGSSFVAGESPRPYADFPAGMDTAATETLPDVAVFELLGPDRARLIFPAPYRESLVNVLTLSR
ncbi:MAG TPA: DUF4893 domain-containing protein [Paracoccus sp. (in: a-proteobacteria)]|nr:DUF4893 domain-containing protein [Paracoccus sp. (in: a-proteobacteria)]